MSNTLVHPQWAIQEILERQSTQNTVYSSYEYAFANAKIYSLYGEAYHELNAYLNLGKGWDGYSGQRFDRRLIRSCQSVLIKVVSFFLRNGIVPTEITPGPASDGSVDIEVGYKRKKIIFTYYPNSSEVNIYRETKQNVQEVNFPIQKVDMERELSWLLI